MRGRIVDLPGDPCPKCGTPLINMNPKMDQPFEHGIRRWLKCPVDEQHFHHMAWEYFPSVHRDLWPGEWPIGFKCPHCNNPVEIPLNRTRIECPSCNSWVYRDGGCHPCCPVCGHRHRGENSIKFCRAYHLFRKTTIESWDSAGTIENNEWSGIVSWSEIRDRVLERDDYTCSWPGCGFKSRNGLIEVHHIIPKDAHGSNNPRNLRCLCLTHHQEAHKLIGDGYEAYPKVVAALRAGNLPPEERIEILAGNHQIITETREILSIKRDPNPQHRQLQLDLKKGIQKTINLQS